MKADMNNIYNYKHAPVGYFRLTTAGTLLDANKKFLSLLGFGSVEEYKLFVSDNDDVELYHSKEKLFSLLKEKKSISDFPNQWLKKDNQMLYVKEALWMVEDVDGKPIFYDGIIEETLTKKSEKHLLQSEENYQKIIETMREGLWEIDENAITTYVNPAMSNMLGYERVEMIGKHLFDFMDDDEKKVAGEKIKQRQEGQSEQHDFTFQKKDGSEIYCLLEASSKCDENGKYCGSFAIVTDLTERKKTELTLKESEERFRYILKYDPNAIAVYDKDLHYIMVSDRYLKDYSIKYEGIIGKHHYEVFPEIPERWREIHQRTLNGEILHSDDDYFDRPDGSRTYNRWECRPWYDADGKIGGMITYTEVITERKLAEIALKESEEKYKRLVENAKDFIYSASLSDGKYVYVNSAAYDITGYKPEEWYEKPLLIKEIMHPDSVDYFYDKWERLINGKFDPTYEYKIIHKDGTERWIFQKNVVIKDEYGKPSFIEGIAYDITDVKTKEQELVKHKKDLQELYEELETSYEEQQTINEELERSNDELRDLLIQLEKSESTLKDHKKLLDDTGRMAKVGGWTLNAETLEVTWTDETYRIHEIPIGGEIPLDKALDFYPGNDREKLSKAIERALEAGVPYDMEIRFVTAKGKKLWTHTKCKPKIVDGKVVMLYGTFQDITDKKNAEISLRESEEKYRFLTEATSEFICQHAPDGTFTYVTPSSKFILGYEPEELIGKNPYDFFHPDDIEHIKQNGHERALDGKGSNTVEYRFRKKDGTYIWFDTYTDVIKDENGNVKDLITRSRDITERIIAEKERENAYTLLESVIKQAPFAVNVLEGGFNEIKSVIENDESIRIIGESLVVPKTYNADNGENLNSRFYTIDGKTEIPLAKMPGAKAFKGEFTRNQNIMFRHPDGTEIMVEASASPIYDEDGNVSVVITTFHDITERIKAEKEREKYFSLFKAVIEQAPFAVHVSEGKFNDINVVIENDESIRIMGEAIVSKKIDADKTEDLNCRYYSIDGKTEVPLAEMPGTRAFKGEVIKDEHFLFRHPDGTEIIVEANATPVYDENKNLNAVVVTFHDITERMKAEISLRESEAKFRSYIENAPDGIFIADEKGEYIEVNKAACEMTGYSEDELLSMSIPDLIPPDSIKDGITHFEKAKNKGYSSGMTKYQTKDGEVKYWTIEAVKLSDKRYLGFTKDITELRNIQNQLQESRKQIKKKLDSLLLPEGDISNLSLSDIVDVDRIQLIMDDFYRLTNVGVAILDLEGNVLVATGWQDICTKFHRCHPETNKHCLESDLELSKGIKKGEYKIYKCKNNMWDIATPIIIGDKHLGNLYLGQFLFEGEQTDNEYFRKQAKIYGFDEEEYLNALHSVPRWSREFVDAVMSFYSKFSLMISQLSYGNIKLARTLTEQKRIEQKLKEQHDFMQTLLDTIPNPVFYKDVDLRYIGCNKAFEKFLFLNRNDIIGRTAYDVSPEENAKMYQEKDFEILDTENVQNYEAEVVDSKGNIKNVVFYKSVFYQNNKKAGIIGTILDITERKKYEETLHKAKLDAEQANKAKNIFLANMSHELRSPLTSINGFSQLMLETGLEEYEIIEYSRFIYNSGTYLLRLINEILELSKIETGKSILEIETVVMSELKEDVMLLVTPLLKKKEIDFYFEIGNDIPEYIATDKVRLKQILINLISNAIKFTDDGQVSIDIRKDTDDCILFSISDTGPGIPEEKLSTIFEPFQQVDKQKSKELGGTGLGLAITKRLIDLMNGQIWVESKVGTGTAFFFTITDLSEEESEKQKTEAEKEKDEKEIYTSFHYKKVLIVEDLFANFILIKAMLKLFRFEVFHAESGEDALQMLEEHEYDLVLMDIQLPGISGLEVTEQIRKQKSKSELPIIAVTAYAYKDDSEKCMRAGCNSYVSKPIDRAELISKIRKLL